MVLLVIGLLMAGFGVVVVVRRPPAPDPEPLPAATPRTRKQRRAQRRALRRTKLRRTSDGLAGSLLILIGTSLVVPAVIGLLR